MFDAVLPLLIRTLMIGMLPLLAVALIAGVGAGILQRILGVHESVISYGFKLLGVIVVGALLFPTLSVLLQMLAREAFQ